METGEALAARRSCRNYLPDLIASELLEQVLRAAMQAPSAGNSAALDLMVLEGPAETGSYWDVTLPAGQRRDGFGWPGLLAAPVLVIPTVRPQAYVERYAEGDKVSAGLGGSVGDWVVPYWYVDGGASIMAMLISATSFGLGSLLFGQFGHTEAVAARFGIPGDRRALGTVAIGWPAPDRGGRSAGRRRPPIEEIVHRSRW